MLNTQKNYRTWFPSHMTSVSSGELPTSRWRILSKGFLDQKVCKELFLSAHYNFIIESFYFCHTFYKLSENKIYYIYKTMLWYFIEITHEYRDGHSQTNYLPLAWLFTIAMKGISLIQNYIFICLGRMADDHLHHERWWWLINHAVRSTFGKTEQEESRRSHPEQRWKDLPGKIMRDRGPEVPAGDN